jgi:hypothetical protein
VGYLLSLTTTQAVPRLEIPKDANVRSERGSLTLRTKNLEAHILVCRVCLLRPPGF